MLTILSFIAVAAAQPPAAKATPITSLPAREATDEDPGADVEALSAAEGVSETRRKRHRDLRLVATPERLR